LESIALFANPMVLFFGNNPHISVIKISIKISVLLISVRDFLPQFTSRIFITTADMKGDDLAGVYIDSNPYLLLVIFITNKTPHLVCFNVQKKWQRLSVC
jgi:hypothetical protein